MTTHQSPTGPVLVGVTDTPEARAAASYAAQLAADTHRELLLAHAFWNPSNPIDVASRGMIGELETAAKTMVDTVAAEIGQTHPVQIRTAVAADKPARFLGRLATTASTLVLGQDAATLIDRVTYGAVAGHSPPTHPARS